MNVLRIIFNNVPLSTYNISMAEYLYIHIPYCIRNVSTAIFSPCLSMSRRRADLWKASAGNWRSEETPQGN